MSHDGTNCDAVHNLRDALCNENKGLQGLVSQAWRGICIAVLTGQRQEDAVKGYRRKVQALREARAQKILWVKGVGIACHYIPACNGKNCAEDTVTLVPPCTVVVQEEGPHYHEWPAPESGCEFVELWADAGSKAYECVYRRYMPIPEAVWAFAAAVRAAVKERTP